MATSTPIFNKLLAKDRREVIKFAEFLAKKKLDVNQTLLMTNTEYLLGVYLSYFEEEYNIGIHADNSCFIIYYIDPAHVAKPYKYYLHESGFTQYIHEWYASTKEEVTTAMNNYNNAIVHVINLLTKLPF